ncbi:MAG TPA: SRPBCC family protein, partial [Burkholderiales bacterium]|nr:SRPBCC family protein [Burkholderiales bacterium]
LAGAGLLYHAWTGRIPFAESVAGAALEPMLVSDSVQVGAGRDSTYRFWRNVQNLPSIMKRVERVEQLDQRRSRWTVRTAQGQVVSWVSEITDDDPGKAIYWRSVDSPVRHEGVVRFEDVPNDALATKVTVEMRYMLPAGLRGEMARQALGDPQRDLHEDLQRLKQTLEHEDFLMAAPPGA